MRSDVKSLTTALGERPWMKALQLLSHARVPAMHSVSRAETGCKILASSTAQARLKVVYEAYDEMSKGISASQELLLPVDEGLQNSVLSSLASEWVMAIELSAAPKSIVTVNMAATAFARAVLWSESMELLFKSAQAMLEADSYSYNVLGLSRKETLSWRRAWCLLAPHQGVSSVIESFNSAMTCCEKAMLWQASAEMLCEAERRSLKASSAS